MLSKPSIRRRAKLVVGACLLGVIASGCVSMGSNEPSATNERADQNERPVPERVARAFAAAMDAMRAKDWVTAELGFEQLIADHPELTGAYVNLAIAYREDGRKDDAEAMLERALEVDPGFPPANNELGVMLREQGRFAEAEAAYRRAIERDPSYGPAHRNLGILLDLYLGRPAEALGQYRSYQALLDGPDQELERWIVEIDRRVQSDANAERLAQGEAP